MSTICAISTAQGGAIGVVRISGPEAITIADRIFEVRKPLKDVPAGRLVFGKIIDDTPIVNRQSSNRQCLDEVLVSVFRAPHSYTGEDSVEISCHGSSYILQRTIELLVANGCRMAGPGEYTQRAFLNGKMDLSQAEAVADLIASSNAASHRLAMNQMRGGFSKELAHLRDELLEMTSLLELELDFSEEDVEFADRKKLTTLAHCIHDEISRLTSSFRLGNALKNGVPVAIIGAPNVGKSTLLNALLKDDRAIVSDIQGTTRDIIEDTITIDGITFRFIDTAGIRHTSDTIEQMGIERSIRAAEKAQIIILLTEPGVDYPDINPRPDQTIIRITNKTSDFQALNGIGVKELEEQLVKSLSTPNSQFSNFNSPFSTDSDLLVTNMRHYEALTLAKDDIARAIQSLDINLSGDLISEDLRQCLTHLSEIVGEISNTEVLQTIFSRFCIGK